MLLERAILTMLITLNQFGFCPKSPKNELTSLALSTFPLSESFFHRKDWTLLTFLAFWLNCRVVIARKPYIKIGFGSPFCIFLTLSPGAGPFSDMRSNQKNNFGTRKILSWKKAFFWSRTQGGSGFPYIYIYICCRVLNWTPFLYPICTKPAKT